MLPDGKMKVELIITNEQIQIAKSSVAQIMDSGLIGGREIAIINNFSDTNYVQSGDKLKTSNKLGLTDELANQIGPVKDKVEVLLENANKLIENLNATLDASTQQKLKASIASLELLENVILGNLSNSLCELPSIKSIDLPPSAMYNLVAGVL
jgi:phospholipid/cholesterol/gamma-HCH transport system substrate-binding protein